MPVPSKLSLRASTRSGSGAVAVLGLAALLGACSGGGSGPSPAGAAMVLTDGLFDEWSGVAPLIEDPTDAEADSAVDFGAVWAQDDPRYLHLAIEVGRPVNPQSTHGTISLLLDADGDPATGGPLFDLAGVDAVVELSRRDRPRPGGWGAGNGVRTVTSDGPGELQSAYPAGLLVSPNAAADRFELRLLRDPASPLPLASGDGIAIQLAFTDERGVRDRTAPATYRWSSPGDPSPRPFAGPLAAGEGNFRMLHWNVAGATFARQPAALARILVALQPHVVLFDEISGEVVEGAIADFFTAPSLAALGDWRWALGRSGGRQRNLVASRLPLRPEPSLLEVAYDPGALERLGEEAADESFDALLALEAERGVPTAGAWVELAGREVLFVPFDLQCCGYDGSPEDHLRVLQAATLRSRVAAALAAAPPGAPVVLGGDANLVGSTAPLELLRLGLDPNGHDLAVSPAYRLADHSTVTWRDPGGAVFTPARLDFTLYPASALVAVRAFVFDVEDLSDPVRRKLGLEPDDSLRTSNHLPVVTDLRWAPFG